MQDPEDQVSSRISSAILFPMLPNDMLIQAIMREKGCSNYFAHNLIVRIRNTFQKIYLKARFFGLADLLEMCKSQNPSALTFVIPQLSEEKLTESKLILWKLEGQVISKFVNNEKLNTDKMQTLCLSRILIENIQSDFNNIVPFDVSVTREMMNIIEDYIFAGSVQYPFILNFLEFAGVQQSQEPAENWVSFRRFNTSVIQLKLEDENKQRLTEWMKNQELLTFVESIDVVFNLDIMKELEMNLHERIESLTNEQAKQKIQQSIEHYVHELNINNDILFQNAILNLIHLSRLSNKDVTFQEARSDLERLVLSEQKVKLHSLIENMLFDQNQQIRENAVLLTQQIYNVPTNRASDYVNELFANARDRFVETSIESLSTMQPDTMEYAQLRNNLQIQIIDISNANRESKSNEDLAIFVDQQIQLKREAREDFEQAHINIFAKLHGDEMFKPGPIRFFRYSDIYDASDHELHCSESRDPITLEDFDPVETTILIEVRNSEICPMVLMCWDGEALARGIVGSGGRNPITMLPISREDAILISQTLHGSEYRPISRLARVMPSRCLQFQQTEGKEQKDIGTPICHAPTESEMNEFRETIKNWEINESAYRERYNNALKDMISKCRHDLDASHKRLRPH